jgi:hypothetical protein
MSGEVHNRVLVAKRDEIKPIGTLRRRWEDHIKTDIRGNWAGLIWLRVGTSGVLLSNT